MDSTAPVSLSLRWHAPVVVMTLGLMVILALIIYSPDLGSMAGIFLVAPLAVITLAGLAIRARKRARLLCVGLLCFCALASWQMFKHSESIRSEARWLVGSRHWKAAVLEQSASPHSGIKWVVWDGWGMFAQDTDVYLVSSPDDALRNYAPSNLSGLPCPVWNVQRLEKYWYSVTFYTNQGWGYCGNSQP